MDRYALISRLAGQFIGRPAMPGPSRLGARAAGLAVAAMVIGWSGSAAAQIKIAVEDIRGVVATKAQWQGLEEYLTQQTGQAVTFVPLTSEKAMDAAASHQVDFMLGNPAITTMIQRAHHTDLIATLEQPWGTRFGGVIFTTPNTGVKTIADLKGKKLITHIVSSAGGHLYQRYHLQLKGIDVNTAFASIKEVPRQDGVVLAVKSGAFDVGFCRTGIIEDLVKKGKVDPSEIVVIDRVDDPAYPFMHSTQLYSEWYMAALAGTDPAVEAKIKSALLALRPDSKVAEAAGIRGFKEPVSNQPIIDLLTALKIAPFNT